MTQRPHLHGESPRAHGVRLNWLGDETVLVSQTIKRGPAQNAPFVVEKRSSGIYKEVFVNYADDAELLRTIKLALNGQLDVRVVTRSRICNPCFPVGESSTGENC